MYSIVANEPEGVLCITMLFNSGAASKGPENVCVAASNANQYTKRDIPVVESRIVDGIAVVKPGTDVVSSVVSCVADGTVDSQTSVVGGLVDVSSVDSGNAVAQQHGVDCTLYVICISIAACSF